MELVYLWVEDYKNIHEQGFNFSPRFNCHYDVDSNELTIDKNDDYIDNFFGENINVTAIVGKNGSGKSSIIEILQSILVSSPMYRKKKKFKYILVFKIDEKQFVDDEFINIEKNILVFNNFRNLKIPIDIIEEVDENFFFTSLFLDAELPYNRFNEYTLASENFYAIPDFDNTKTFQYIDLEYSSISKKVIELNINDYQRINFSPKKITVTPDEQSMDKFRNFVLHDYHKHARFDDELIEKIDDIIEKIQFSNDMFAFSLLLLNIDDIKEKKLNKVLKKLTNLTNLTNDNYYEVIYNFFNDNKIKSDMCFKEYESILYNKKNISKINRQLLIKYFDYVDIEIFDEYDRSFYSLSHGEKMIFGIDVYLIHTIKVTEERNYVFCFDEPDISLHPNWQKQYLSLFINSFSKLNKNIHLIVTTHSPFLLSDTPKQNIVFLDKDERGNCKVVDGLNEKKQTFGANIHTLLSDSFFMEDGLMGEFANVKINEIIEFFDNKNELYLENKERLYQIINAIGEPFLKEKLLFMYGEKFPKTKEEQIAEYEAKIERLKSDDKD